MIEKRRYVLTGLVALAGAGLLPPDVAEAASASEIDRESSQALRLLYATQPKARELSKRAKGVLVFPNIIKAGLLIGGQGGNGALRVGNKTVGYYNIAAASFGLQAGAQKFSYAMFFMNQAALDYLNKSDGWSIGSGPSVVVIDQGAAASLTSTTLSQDVYAFPFGQKGLMAGLGLEGSKITRIQPSA
jgi:lipid-binding SYLF domain-containing protein